MEYDSSQEAILQERFVSSTLFTFDIASFDAYVKANRTYRNFSIKIGNEYQWNIGLAENELRSADYTEMAMTDNGPVLLPRSECITFAGYIQGTDNQVRLNIQSHRVWGFVDSPEGMFYIEPLNRYIDNAEEDSYLMYEVQNLVEKEYSCGVDHSSSHDNSEHIRNHMEGIRKSAGDDCRKLEIATEADWEFNNNGNDNSDILGNLNLVEAIYESTYSMTFFVVFQNIWTTSGDPYTTTVICDNPGSLGYEEQFQSYWITNFGNIRRDLSALYTGKDLDGGTIGCAFTGAFGNNSNNNNGVYSVNQWFNLSTALRTIVVAHEIGHNFGASHNSTGSNIMNASIGSNTTQIFVAASQTQMNADMDFASATLNDGRSALRIRDFPNNSNTNTTTFYADVDVNRSANVWHMDREMRINSLILDNDMEFIATERILLKPGYKAVIDDAGNSLILKVGACNNN